MKKILNFFKSGFTNLGHSYYKQLYNYEGSLYIGYVVIQNYMFFWIPVTKRLAVCCDEEELQKTLNLLK